jgi:hypothetical protein
MALGSLGGMPLLEIVNMVTSRVLELGDDVQFLVFGSQVGVLDPFGLVIDFLVVEGQAGWECQHCVSIWMCYRSLRTFPRVQRPCCALLAGQVVEENL